MKKITVLGSTGSVGRQTLEVVAAHPEEFQIVGLACRGDIELLEQQMCEFHPKFVGIIDEEKGKLLKKKQKRTVYLRKTWQECFKSLCYL